MTATTQQEAYVDVQTWGQIRNQVRLPPNVISAEDCDEQCPGKELNLDAEHQIICLVARLVGFKEVEWNTEAQQSIKEEFDKLRSKPVWDENMVIEEEDLLQWANSTGTDIHIGRVFATCTEKNYEMELTDPSRKYKGRVCYDGRSHMVKDRYGAKVIYQHMVSQPASMPAAKSGIAFGLLPGHQAQAADAVQAYTQAEFTGTPTWVSLPKSEWPEHWRGMRKPVCPLLRKIYGHPQAGPIYERWAERQLISIQFLPVSQWSGVYFCLSLMLCLILYVDDFILSGPAKHLECGWALVRSVIDIDNPTDVTRYLGCHHHFYKVIVEDPQGRRAEAKK